MQLDLRDSLTILVRSNVACFCKYIVYPSKAKEKLFPIIQHYQKYPCVSIFVTDRKVIPKMLISIFDNKRRAIFFSLFKRTRQEESYFYLFCRHNNYRAFIVKGGISVFFICEKEKNSLFLRFFLICRNKLYLKPVWEASDICTRPRWQCTGIYSS
jgi:hypothetical protein